MRIGLLVTSIGNFGKQGFYNTQEIGLARALSQLVDEVKVYKLVSLQQEKRQEKISGCNNVSILFLPSKSLGNNGMIDISVLDKTLDALVYFSDTQFAVPKVYKWAIKNNIKFFPYIGVLESHSTNRIKKLFVNWMFNRNLKIYRNSHCLVKTPTVEKQLHSLGGKNISVTPVGLDSSLLNHGGENIDCNILKTKYGYQASDKVILFIGRLIEEKQPLRMIDIFFQVYKRNKDYRLLMVGTGGLQKEVVSKINKYGRLIEEKQPLRMIDIFFQVYKRNKDYRLLMVGTGGLQKEVVSKINKYAISNQVQIINKVPNSEIWELYRIADCFVNLNQQEIFGMAILEAMYYECKVIAWRAPGPEFIIEDGVSGYLVDSEEMSIDEIFDNRKVSKTAHEIVVEKFTWDKTAHKIKILMER